MVRRRFCDEQEQMTLPIVFNTMGQEKMSMGGLLEMPATDNHIYFYEDVETDSILSLNKNIREINNLIKRDLFKYSKEIDVSKIPIYLHINSHGGDLFAVLAAIDTILNSEHPVYTIVEGAAASAATFLSIVGKKRFITKNSFMLIHQLSAAMWGKYEELKDEMENNEMFMDVIKNMYKQYTKLGDTELEAMLKRDVWFNAEKSLQYGLVDEVL